MAARAVSHGGKGGDTSSEDPPISLVGLRRSFATDLWECESRMKAAGIRTHGQCTCAVEVSGSDVDAGAEVTVRALVSCPHGCDLRGQRVSIRNQDDTELASTELTERAGKAYVTSAVALRVPLEVGEHICRAVISASEKDGVLHEEISTEFSIVARAHTASVIVWGVPSAIAAGERFTLKIGVKCSAACRLTGRPLDIVDHEGAHVGAASLADDMWPGTNALYFAEVEVVAPPEPGGYLWQARIPGSDSSVPHAAGSCAFAVNVVSPPDHEVTVEAIDREKQTPIEGAHVLVHPYRALTDERGVAKIRVAKGNYKLVVSGFKYIAFQNIIVVAGDVTTRAELTTEPEGQEDYR
jgi:hypothetical protein